MLTDKKEFLIAKIMEVVDQLPREHVVNACNRFRSPEEDDVIKANTTSYFFGA